MSFLSSKWSVSCIASLVVLVSILTFVGCSKHDGEATSSSAGGTNVASAGKAVYDSNRCANCHSINGQGGRKAPDLSHEGANAQHTPQWIADHVKNPRSHNPGSRMPAFEGKISDKDLQALGDYLASLK